MACMLSLVQENCSVLTSQLGTCVQQYLCMERAICVMRTQYEQDARQRLCWRFRALHVLAACLQRLLHAETAMGDGSQPVRMLNAPAARECGCHGPEPCDPESELL